MNYLAYNYPKDESKAVQYPQKLCDYLEDRFFGQGYRVLDVGCGRGNHITAWRRKRPPKRFLSIQAFGIERSKPDRPTLFIDYLNVERDRFPYPDNYFHIVFSKSLIEHIHHTDHLLSEMKRVLRPDGLVICMTPDWETDYKIFYDDPTHVRPYTQRGLKQLFVLAGFKEVTVEGFYQLPILWRWKWLEFVTGFSRILSDRLKYKKGEQRVWIRHSKERMILLTARK